MTFKELELLPELLQALHNEGYEIPTPIQEQSIPHLLEGRDLFGCAQTGTGKTAAFALPILQILTEEPHGGPRNIRALILAPTRELALQIGDSFRAYGKNLNVRHAVVFGGVPQRAQTDALRRGVDILVATPGRLLDLIQQGFIHLKKVEIFVLDEADRMLDMGFIHDIKRVIALLPTEKQTMLFSATLPKEIRELMAKLLKNPVHVEVAPVSTTAERIEQGLYYLDKGSKRDLLHQLLTDVSVKNALVFTRTKHGADKVAKELSRRGVKAEAIHGNKSQNARTRSLSDFKNNRLKVLVATDIASRGIDVEELSHVINFDLPEVPETYVHRIGRTGRAGSKGIALSFCTEEELDQLKDIHKLIRTNIPLVETHDFAISMPANSSSRINSQPTASRGGNNRNKPSGSPKSHFGQNRNKKRYPAKSGQSASQGHVKSNF